jgi:hypothetical protein
MRLVSMGLLVASLAAGACNRTESVAAATPDAKSAAALAGEPNAASAVGTKASLAVEEREITIPAGTIIPVTLDTSVGSDISRVEQSVSAHVTRPVMINGHTALPAGSHLGGVVTDATRSGKVKGLAHVAVKFSSLTPGHDGSKYRIATTTIGRTAEATKKKDAMKIGAPAAGGAIIGAIAGGKKGAAIGTAVGGGAGTAVVLSTRGEEVHMPKGSALSVKLTEPLTVRVRG